MRKDLLYLALSAIIELDRARRGLAWQKTPFMELEESLRHIRHEANQGPLHPCLVGVLLRFCGKKLSHKRAMRQLDLAAKILVRFTATRALSPERIAWLNAYVQNLHSRLLAQENTAQLRRRRATHRFGTRRGLVTVA